METRLSSNRWSFGLPDSVAWRVEATRSTETIELRRESRRAGNGVFKRGMTQGTGQVGNRKYRRMTNDEALMTKQ